MAKKKRPHSRKPTDQPPSDLPFDPRQVEATLREFLSALSLGEQDETPRSQDETPLSKAQAIVDKAFETENESEQIRLAKKALKVSPDCADAYVLLAERAKTRKESLKLYSEAVEAGHRALGPRYFEDSVGEFWGILETRPYMRARFGLADTLWASGHRVQAIDHLQELLRLNDGDNQGVRYVLAGWLLNMDRYDDLAKLLDKYDEPSATWAYTRALLSFRQNGESTESRALLKAARKVNKHVPAYLLGQKPLPREQPHFYSPGDADEARMYAASALGGWRTTPGAIAWLRQSLPRPRKKAGASQPEAQGPLPLVKKRLERLPQSFDVWQADFREFGPRIEIDGELIHPWLILVSSRTHDLILTQGVIKEPPSADVLWDQLADAMQKPVMSDPHRPTEIQVCAGEWWSTLTPHFEALGIHVEVLGELDHLDFLFDKLAEHMATEQPPGLLEMPGVQPNQVASFYHAAADFYRRAPWRRLGYESAIKIECSAFESGPWYAVVMGQSGLTFGVALYDDLKLLRKLWSDDRTDEENARDTVALTVTFEDKSALPDSDIDAVEEYGWEIAGPEAYPTVFRKERGMSMRPPLSWEIDLMTACLHAIPDFVDQHPLDDPTTATPVVPVSSRELYLTLSWIDD